MCGRMYACLVLGERSRLGPDMEACGCDFHCVIFLVDVFYRTRLIVKLSTALVDDPLELTCKDSTEGVALNAISTSEDVRCNFSS